MTDRTPSAPRSREREIARYNWITPKTFGERIGGERPKSASHVRRLIRSGGIRPDMVFATNPGAKRKDYRINPNAVDLFIRDHSVAADDDPAAGRDGLADGVSQ